MLLKDLQPKTIIEIDAWISKTYYPNGTQNGKNKGPCYKVSIEATEGSAGVFVEQNEMLFNFIATAPDRFYARIAILIKSYNERYGTSCDVMIDQAGQPCIWPKEYVEPTMVDINALKRRLNTHIKEMKNERYKEMVYFFLKYEDVKNLFFDAPASELGAHNYRGGLLAHVVRLMDLVDSVGHVFEEQLYNEFNPIPLDYDLLKTCALLHDVGKIDALRVEDGKVYKTLDGQLFEQSYLGAKRLWRLLNDFQLEDRETERFLEQAVTSSQGRLDYGALNTARTKEALIFSRLEGIEGEMSHFELIEQRHEFESGFVKMFSKNVYIKPQPHLTVYNSPGEKNAIYQTQQGNSQSQNNMNEPQQQGLHPSQSQNSGNEFNSIQQVKGSVGTNRNQITHNQNGTSYQAGIAFQQQYQNMINS